MRCYHRLLLALAIGISFYYIQNLILVVTVSIMNYTEYAPTTYAIVFNTIFYLVLALFVAIPDKIKKRKPECH
jgi:hypothetical protein